VIDCGRQLGAPRRVPVARTFSSSHVHELRRSPLPACLIVLRSTSFSQCGGALVGEMDDCAVTVGKECLGVGALVPGRFGSILTLSDHPCFQVILPTRQDAATLQVCDEPLPGLVTADISPLTQSRLAFRLYSKAVVLGYRRSNHAQQVHTSLLQIEGVTSRTDTEVRRYHQLPLAERPYL